MKMAELFSLKQTTLSLYEKLSFLLKNLSYLKSCNSSHLRLCLGENITTKTERVMRISEKNIYQYINVSEKITVRIKDITIGNKNKVKLWVFQWAITLAERV